MLESWNMKNLLIFDESMNAIDVKTESKIFDRIIDLKKTVLFVTHNLHVFENITR